MTPESNLKAQVKAYLDERGAYWFMPRPTEWGHNGVDFFCCIAGRFVAIETKIWPGKATPRQLRCLQQVRDAGGVGFVAYDLEGVRANLAVGFDVA